MGNARVTIRDVARLAGTSVAAASAGLNGTAGRTIRISEATRARIAAAAAQLGYVGNPIAKSLATGRTRVLGVMLPYADAFVDQNPFCMQVLFGVMREAVAHHYNAMLYTAVGGRPEEQAASMADSRVDGLVLVMPEVDGKLVARCERNKVPFVAVLHPPRPGLWTVNADDFGGGLLAARHLVGLGHQRIAHLRGNGEVSTSRPRFEGFLAGLAEAGVVADPRYMVSASFDWRGGLAATRSLLALPSTERPTAIFAANDLCAQGALYALAEAGLSAPEDMAVVGYDDTPYAAMTHPALTSVNMHIAEMGALAARMLIARCEGAVVEDAQPVLPVSLTVRQSCGAIAPNALSMAADGPRP